MRIQIVQIWRCIFHFFFQRLHCMPRTMKLSLSIPLLLSVASTSLAATMGSIRNGKAISGLIKNSRRLDQEEEDYAFLQNYELKFVACKGGQLTQNDNGQYVDTAKVVVYRLCPSDGSCDSDDSQGCSGGYGEYVVSLNTYSMFKPTLKFSVRTKKIKKKM